MFKLEKCHIICIKYTGRFLTEIFQSEIVFEFSLSFLKRVQSSALKRQKRAQRRRDVN